MAVPDTRLWTAVSDISPLMAVPDVWLLTAVPDAWLAVAGGGFLNFVSIFSAKSFCAVTSNAFGSVIKMKPYQDNDF